MKAQQYREMSPDELKDKLEEMQRHLFDLRSQAVTEKLENSKALINVNRDKPLPAFTHYRFNPGNITSDIN